MIFESIACRFSYVIRVLFLKRIKSPSAPKVIFETADDRNAEFLPWLQRKTTVRLNYIEVQICI
jgi:hypothetical protein